MCETVGRTFLGLFRSVLDDRNARIVFGDAKEFVRVRGAKANERRPREGLDSPRTLRRHIRRFPLQSTSSENGDLVACGEPSCEYPHFGG
jgi:hypothetical protein